MTDNIDIGWLFVALAGLCACSAFFAMSETCLMALNRYRLKHLIREGSRGARLAGSLLDRTDELLAFILAGNTLINAAITILVAETCMMALNRYRLKHLVREGNRGARLANSLLERTDQLLSFILAGNTII
ncbi:MAG TPA: CNNM domain-containing protein, partial [Usitatibacter sp.]